MCGVSKKLTDLAGLVKQRGVFPLSTRIRKDCESSLPYKVNSAIE